MKNVTLKEICEYAEERQIPLNRILDAWNADKDALIRHYHQDKKGFTKEPAILGEELFTPLEGKLNDLERMINADVRGLKRILNSIEHQVEYKDTSESLWVMVSVSSPLIEHFEEEHLVFEPVGKDDEGVQNAVEATISELSYRLLLNM